MKQKKRSRILKVLLNTVYSVPGCFSLVVEITHFCILATEAKNIYILRYYKFVLLLPLEGNAVTMEKRICFNCRYP